MAPDRPRPPKPFSHCSCFVVDRKWDRWLVFAPEARHHKRSRSISGGRKSLSAHVCLARRGDILLLRSPDLAPSLFDEIVEFPLPPLERQQVAIATSYRCTGSCPTGCSIFPFG